MESVGNPLESVERLNLHRAEELRASMNSLGADGSFESRSSSLDDRSGQMRCTLSRRCNNETKSGEASASARARARRARDINARSVPNSSDRRTRNQASRRVSAILPGD